jgi:aspartate aminotransferase
MISEKISNNLKKSSWIRAMFDEGERLRAIYGNENVYDYSLGNPETEPPAKVDKVIEEIVASRKPGIHRYMSNAGYESTRKSMADYINLSKGSNLSASHVIMTSGAAGGLNVVLKTILNPGDEVIVFSPYFVEYLFYIDNHGGIPVVVPTNKHTFMPEAETVQKYITEKTRAVIINTPNNPTGVIYGAETLKALAGVLEEAQERFGLYIYLLSDEPYDRIVYDNKKVPSVFEAYENSVVVNSFSKSLALPGERIGYVAVNDRMKNSDVLVNGLIFCNRTLGFVNAPALMQRVVEKTVGETVDIEQYTARRDILYDHLTSLGFKCLKPDGAFYLFPESPAPDDVEFVKEAQKFNLLLVPGVGFGCPGHFRISYCISMDTIKRSLPAFEKLAKVYGLCATR